MKVTQEQIRQLIKDKKIGAISLDTSAFDRQARRLERGLLRRLQQFSASDVAFVLSDVVLRELRAHLIADATEAQADLKRALRKLEANGGVDKRECDVTADKLLAPGSPETIADKRLDAFLGAIAADVAKAKDADLIGEVLDRYFASNPPFAKKETKKHEFPDAVALLTLENWATQNNTIVLAVTHDNDWMAFIESSRRIVAVGDLAEALGMFQNETANYLCSEILTTVRNGDPKEIIPAISDAIIEQQSKVDVSIAADSQFSVDEEYSDLELEFGAIHSLESESAIEAVEYDGKTLVARMQVEALAHIKTHFSFAKWDSIDREYISMGSENLDHDQDVILEVLVTFSGSLPSNPIIESIELVPETIHAEFHNLEPDWMSRREEDDPN